MPRCYLTFRPDIAGELVSADPPGPGRGGRPPLPRPHDPPHIIDTQHNLSEMTLSRLRLRRGHRAHRVGVVVGEQLRVDRQRLLTVTTLGWVDRLARRCDRRSLVPTGKPVSTAHPNSCIEH
jgi:hypothetical protein